MRLRKLEKIVMAGVLAGAMMISTAAFGQQAKAEQKEIAFAQGADGTYHENSFELARVSEDDGLSSYEEGNGKHWVKLFSTFDGSKNIFDNEAIPDDTAKIKVVFDITNYDLDQAYPLTWATGIGGWTSGKPTGVTIDQSGTYEAVLDFASETDGIGRAISAADINIASLQLVFQLGEKEQAGIANVKKTKVTFKACYAYNETDQVTAAEVIPIDDSKQDVVNDGNQDNNTDNNQNDNVSPVKKVNKVTKIQPVKKTVTLKKGKKATANFKVTATDKNSKTTDKISKVTVSNKKVAKVVKKSLSKGKCTVTVQGLKKGKTTLTVKVGSKKAQVTIKVK